MTKLSLWKSHYARLKTCEIISNLVLMNMHDRFDTLHYTESQSWLKMTGVLPSQQVLFFQKWFARHLSNEPHHRVNNTSIQSFVCPSFSPWTSWNVAAPPPRSGVTFFFSGSCLNIFFEFLMHEWSKKSFFKRLNSYTSKFELGLI